MNLQFYITRLPANYKINFGDHKNITTVFRQTFIDLNECTETPCSTDANCTNTPGSFACNCHIGYTGNGASCTGKCGW